jgi:hypothetical protein
MAGKPGRKRQLGKPKCGRSNNIKMDLSERRWEGMDWICLAQDRVQLRASLGMVLNFRLS